MLGIGITKDDYSNEAFVGILDSHLNASAAYSVRRLSGKTARCVRIRESGSDNEVDIGFNNNGDLDTASITNFCGSNDGFITVWYDASGNSRNASQTDPDLQPKICDSGSIIEENGRPAILGLDQSSLIMPSSISFSEFSFSMIAEIPSDSGGARSWFSGPSTLGYQRNGSFYTLGASQSNSFLHEYNAWSKSIGDQVYHFFSVDSSGDFSLFVDDNEEASGNKTLTFEVKNLFAGDPPQGKYLEKNMQEVIFWSEPKISSRSSLQQDANTYYNLGL